MSTKGRFSKLARLHSEPSRADGEQGQKLEKGQSAKISGATDAAKEAAAHQCICQSARVSIAFMHCEHLCALNVGRSIHRILWGSFLDVSDNLRQALFGGNPTDGRQIPTQGCEDSLNLRLVETSWKLVVHSSHP